MPSSILSRLLSQSLSSSSVETKDGSNVSKKVECGLTGAVCRLIKSHFGAKSEPAGNGHFSSLNSERCIFLLLEKRDFDCLL